MVWISSRVAWIAAALTIFALLRALRRLVDAHERPVALLVAVVVVLVAAAVPETLGRGRPTVEQAGRRKAGQLLAAGIGTAVGTYLGAGLVVAAVLGVVAAVLVAALWPRPAPPDTDRAA